MTQSFLQRAFRFGCAGAVVALAASAQAQYTTPAAPPIPQTAGAVSTPATPAVSTKAQADANYQAALSACEAKLGNVKSDCISRAKTDYDRAIASLSGSDMPSQIAPNSTGANGGGRTGGESGPVRQSR